MVGAFRRSKILSRNPYFSDEFCIIPLNFWISFLNSFFLQCCMTRSLNILIVDDHKLFREGFALLLKSIEGVKEIFHAEDEDAAVSILNRFNIKIVFMDIKLRSQNGIDVTTSLSKQYIHVKFIALSMYSDKNSLFRMIKAGASGYLPKNTSLDEVNAAIDAVLNGENYYSEALSEAAPSVRGTVKAIKHEKRGKALSKRELEILTLVCKSYSTDEISRKLFISKKTVEVHRCNILAKLHVKNMVEASLFAVNAGILNSSHIINVKK